MADTDNAALQDSESDDFGIPGQQDEADAGITAAPPAGMTQSSTQAPAAPPAPTQQPSAPSSTASQPPKVSGRAMFLGNLLKTLMQGVQNAPGNPRNALDRGFMAASPQNQAAQQAQLSKLQSEADLEKQQVALTGVKALQTEYMLKRLPQQMQLETMKQISAYKDQLIKSGASVEVEGDDEKASDAQAAQMNSNDPRSTSHAGKFYSMPTMDLEGKAKFDVVFVPNKDTLQQDFKYTDADGNEQTLKAGTPMYGAMGKLVDSLHGDMQAKTKEQHKEISDLLTKPVPDAEANEVIGRIQDVLKENTPLAQQNKQALQDRLKSLQAAHNKDFAEKLALQRAGAQIKEEHALAGKDTIVHTSDGDLLMSGEEAKAGGYKDYSTLSTKMAQDIKDKRANADASMDAMQDYKRAFNSANLSAKDRDALRVLTAHVQSEGGSGGVLGGIVEDLPLVGPIGNYANRLLSGTMTSDQYKQLSPAGKEVMSKYAMAVVANFANMKQMLGSVGRNPAMIQAEMAQIPLPYIDKESGNQAFDTKITDLNKRNSSIPKVYRPPKEKSSE